jgi:carboxypeptidase Taq
MPSADSSSPHAILARHLRDLATLGSVASTLGWDEQTQLPDEANALRADQSSLLAKLLHERATDPVLGEAIAKAEEDVGSQNLPADSDEATTARDARRSFDRATKLPGDLVQALARAEVEGHHAWVAARKADDFTAFAPKLREMIGLKQQEADAVGSASGDRYDALLDDYEPGETAVNIEAVFDSLRDPLIELVAKIADSGKVAPREILQRHYPTDRQRELSMRAATACGFRFTAGRLDVAVHPFCTGLGPGDTRMTTRFVEDDLGNSFFSTLHETGHALYEQNLPKSEHFGTGCASSISLGIHESQSRLWENLVGRGRPFWQHFWPVANELFPEQLAQTSLDDFLFAVNDVRPSFIRTESDEATYNLHVLLRFELERALLSGDLSVDDLPAAWDEKMRKYLGVVPDRMSQGCLQDVHWSAGLVGYFPTYTLGNLYSAQIYEIATADLGGATDRDAAFARGEFKPLLDWLVDKVHRHGRRFGARQLVTHITGRPPSAEPLLAHLRQKATEFYEID